MTADELSRMSYMPNKTAPKRFRIQAVQAEIIQHALLLINTLAVLMEG